MEYEKIQKAMENIDNIAKYLNDQGFSFVITAKSIEPISNYDCIISCHNKQEEP